MELGSGAELLALPSLRWHVSSQQETRPVEFFTGHTLQVNSAIDLRVRFAMSDAHSWCSFQVQGVGHPTLSFNATTYSLSQIHTHTPSEHTIDGEQFALEMHFLHTTRTNKTTKHAVLAVMFKEVSPFPVWFVSDSKLTLPLAGSCFSSADSQSFGVTSSRRRRTQTRRGFRFLRAGCCSASRHDIGGRGDSARGGRVAVETQQEELLHVQRVAHDPALLRRGAMARAQERTGGRHLPPIPSASHPLQSRH